MLRTSPYFDDPSLWDPMEIMAIRFEYLIDGIPVDRSFQRHADYAQFISQLNVDELADILQHLRIGGTGKRNKANMVASLRAEIWERLPALITILPLHSYQILLELIDEGGELAISEPLLIEAGGILCSNGLAAMRVTQNGQAVVLRMPDELLARVQETLPQAAEDRETLGVDRVMQAVDRLLDAFGVIGLRDTYALLTNIGMLDGSAFSEGYYAALLRGFDHAILPGENGEDDVEIYICDVLINDPVAIHQSQQEFEQRAPFDVNRLLAENPDDYVLFSEESECLENMLSFFDPLLDDEDDVMICMQTVAGAIKQGFDEEIVVFLGIETLGPQPFEVYEALRRSARMWMNRMNLWTLNGYAQSTARAKRNHREVGRNDPCPCGSGKKYKHCCGNPLKVIK